MTGRPQASRGILTVLVLLSLAVPAISQETAKTDGPPYRVGGEISRPEIVLSTKPVYTEMARRSRVTGTVIMEAVIDEQGNVTDTRVLKGLPMGLDQAALDAIKEWKFKPATREGKPVPVYYVLTVNFQVDNSFFGCGRMLAKLLEQNPDFAAHLTSKHYQDATELLDRLAEQRQADPAIPIARIYLLLDQGQLQEALRKALEMQGSERSESLFSVGAFALRQATDRSQEEARRAEAVELGLRAEDAALADPENRATTILYKCWLIRAKVELTVDPAEYRALTEEADRLSKQATELQKAKDPKTADRP